MSVPGTASLTRTASLEWRLLGSLGLVIVVAALAEVGLAYRTALREADTILDAYMQRTAWSLRAGTILADASVPEESALEAAAEEAPNYEVYVQVWSADGVRSFRSDRRLALPRRAQLGFTNLEANGTTYRVYSLPAGAHIIQVAQDLGARRRVAGTLALRTVTPILLMAPLLMFAIIWAVRRSLVPVARVRRQLAARQPDDLTPVDPEGVPSEIRPLVDELNLLLVRVARAFSAQQHFVAHAAHELRNPLAAIKLQVQGLERAADDGARDLAVERLTSGIDRATRLVEQLLVLARQEARLTAAERTEPVRLADEARSVITEMAPAAQARQIDLGLVHADEGEVAGHRDALQILLRNLLDNAIKYTPPGGAIDVAVRARPQSPESPSAAEITLSVEDSGPGIPLAERERVLERFHRGREPGVLGSGLGLAIVRTIVDLHGATLEFEDPPGHPGLRVAIRFRRMP